MPIVTLLGLYAIMMIGDFDCDRDRVLRPWLRATDSGRDRAARLHGFAVGAAVYVLVAIVINFVVDLLYVWIDPRIQLTA